MQAFDAFTVSRVDVAAATKQNYATHRIRLVDLIGDSDVTTIGWQDVQTVVSALSEDLAPLSVRNYLHTLAMVLDYCDREPNPARDPRVKLPRPEQAIPNPPSAAEVAAIIANAPKRWRLALRLLEASGMRAGNSASSSGETSTGQTRVCGSGQARRTLPAAGSRSATAC